MARAETYVLSGEVGGMPEENRAYINSLGMHTLLTVPMMLGKETVGWICVRSSKSDAKELESKLRTRRRSEGRHHRSDYLRSRRRHLRGLACRREGVPAQGRTTGTIVRLHPRRACGRGLPATEGRGKAGATRTGAGVDRTRRADPETACGRKKKSCDRPGAAHHRKHRE